MTETEKQVVLREMVFRSAHEHARDYCRFEIARIDAKLRAVYEALDLSEKRMPEEFWDLPSEMRISPVVQGWLAEKRFWEEMLLNDVGEFFGPAWKAYRTRKAQQEAQEAQGA